MKMIELTEMQRHELAGSEPARVLDPGTCQRYVLVKEELYERMISLLTEGSDSIQVAKLFEKTMREYDKDDPLLESYQEYRQ
jgi:hypothetical protein